MFFRAPEVLDDKNKETLSKTKTYVKKNYKTLLNKSQKEETINGNTFQIFEQGMSIHLYELIFRNFTNSQSNVTLKR